MSTENSCFDFVGGKPFEEFTKNAVFRKFWKNLPSMFSGKKKQSPHYISGSTIDIGTIKSDNKRAQKVTGDRGGYEIFWLPVSE